MPSPFPGMDPYLEHPARWPGVHQRLMTYIADTLNIALPPHYVAAQCLAALCRSTGSEHLPGRDDFGNFHSAADRIRYAGNSGRGKRPPMGAYG